MRSFGLTIIVLLQFCYTTGAVIGLLDRAYNLLSSSNLPSQSFGRKPQPPIQEEKSKIRVCQLSIVCNVCIAKKFDVNVSYICSMFPVI